MWNYGTSRGIGRGHFAHHSQIKNWNAPLAYHILILCTTDLGSSFITVQHLIYILIRENNYLWKELQHILAIFDTHWPRLSWNIRAKGKTWEILYDRCIVNKNCMASNRKKDGFVEKKREGKKTDRPRDEGSNSQLLLEFMQNNTKRTIPPDVKRWSVVWRPIQASSGTPGDFDPQAFILRGRASRDRWGRDELAPRP